MRIIDITMPKWGMTMQEGVVESWLRAVGDTVAEGDPIAEIETEKANAELEAPADGVIVEILVEAGTTVEVGELVARMETAGG